MPNPITIPIDRSLTPGQQIEAALATVVPPRCERHPHVSLRLKRNATLKLFLEECQSGIGASPWTRRLNHDCHYTFRATYERCPQCPINCGGTSVRHDLLKGKSPCAAIQDSAAGLAKESEPFPTTKVVVTPNLDQTADQQFNAWVAGLQPGACSYDGPPVPLQDLSRELTVGFRHYSVTPVFADCPQCWLEEQGIPPDEAFASFDNFVVEPARIRTHLDMCKEFGRDPRGVLVMAGSPGNGKTHLAYAIMRACFARGLRDCKFIKQRHFLEQHRRDNRPLPFGQEPPEDSTMKRCQRAKLLVFDEMAGAVDRRDIEEDLLDLFEFRVGNYLPTVITTNVPAGEMESAIGTRLLDRLRRANFALLEFNFPSRRAQLNSEYFDRSGSLR